MPLAFTQEDFLVKIKKISEKNSHDRNVIRRSTLIKYCNVMIKKIGVALESETGPISENKCINLNTAVMFYFCISLHLDGEILHHCCIFQTHSCMHTRLIESLINTCRNSKSLLCMKIANYNNQDIMPRWLTFHVSPFLTLCVCAYVCTCLYACACEWNF